MYQEQLLGEFELGHEREFLRDLLAPDPTLQLSAAAGLLEEELFVSQSVAVLVLRPTAGSEVVDEHQRLAIDAALVHARRQLPRRQAIHLARPDHGVLLVAAHGRPPRGSDLLAVGRDLHQSFCVRGEVPSTPRSAVVGIGERQGIMTGAAISYRQASQAAHVAEILSPLGEVVGFGDLGVYRTLAQLPAEELAMSALHPGLSALLSDASAASLLRTLECFLDLAGDVKATSAELNIHRTTLYYRLGKVEQLAGVDLGHGSDRLMLHLGLKLARLARLYPAPQSDAQQVEGPNSPISSL
jgi:sugar diacid utilization regulator